MRLENVIALTHAKLVNEPCVNSFQNIVFEANRVKRGDLFVAFESDSIEIAILNGAYGIVFDRPTQILDIEIAWIQVKNLNEAIKRLLRFKMLQKEIVVYECNEIILKLALQVITQTNFLVINGNVKSIFEDLWQVDERATVLFCPSLSDKDIFANSKTLPKTAILPIEIMEKTLFETSFIYDNIFYERQLISPFFMPYLEELLHLFKTLKINYRLKKFIPIEHFEAVFTNKKFELKSFGTSDKVLIFEKKSELIFSEINFLQSNASWAKIIIIMPLNLKKDESKNIFYYEQKKEILDILKNNSFHFALIVGVDKSILETFTSNQAQLTLDF